jgi:hypothetical protein
VIHETRPGESEFVPINNMLAGPVINHEQVPESRLSTDNIADDLLGDRRMLNGLSRLLQPVAIIKS